MPCIVIMKMNIQETSTLAKTKKETTNQKTEFLKKLGAEANKPKPKELALYENALKHLEGHSTNNDLPWFDLKAKGADKKNVFADFFVAKWTRNAYGGLFVNLNPEKKPLSAVQKKWVARFRGKGYACVTVSTSEEFGWAVKDYAYAAGQMGKQYYNTRWEREV